MRQLYTKVITVFAGEKKKITFLDVGEGVLEKSWISQNPILTLTPVK